MKNYKLYILISLLVCSLLGCEEVSNEMTSDFPQNYETTYGIRKVLQYDPLNINGIDVADKFDFFETVRFDLQFTKGKMSKLTYYGNEVPFPPLNIGNDEVLEIDIELNYDVIPNELRIKDTEMVLFYYVNGEFILPFNLDCSSINYRCTFVNIN